MQVYVYRSSRKPGTYVYLRERDAFKAVPEPLLATLAPLEFALELDLGPDRRLAREDPQAVRRNLLAHGYHLQLPPREERLLDEPD